MPNTIAESGIRPDVGLGVGLHLSALSLNDSSHSWTDDLPVCHLSGLGLSTNQIYREDGVRREEHQFEDRSFRFKLNEDTFFYGVFDGHDGCRASDFASQRMPAEVLLDQLKGKTADEDIERVLLEAFHAVEKGFFESIDDLLAKKANLQEQLRGLTSYEAYQQYPDLVDKLREAMAEVAGGTTAVVALILRQKLYVANVGDSRALLCKMENGVMKVFQLSVDHDIQNEDELLRLSHLGLDVENIRQGSKLGNQENTRCIGNHQVKGGYKDFDILSVAKEEPVIAEPEIQIGIQLDESCRFLLLMSDGLYKSLEEATGTQQSNVDIADMVIEQFATQATLTGVAQAVVDRIVRIHHDTFMRENRDIKHCHKRDDITLLVRNFNQPLPWAMQSGKSPQVLYSSNPLQLAQTPNSLYPTWKHQKIGDPETAAPNLENNFQDSKSIDNTLTQTSSTESPQQLFQNSQSSASITLDENNKVKPYVDFSDFYKTIEEAKQRGELSAEELELLGF